MTYEPSDLTRLRRLPEKAVYDEAGINAILDASNVVNIGYVLDGVPMVLPTLYVRDGHSLLVHGSRSSRMLRTILRAERMTATVTIIDGIRVARSAFESSMAYRGVSMWGHCELINDDVLARRALDRLIDAVLPGRSQEIRPSTEREVNLTSVLRFHIEEASAKVSAGFADDAEDDIETSVWAGVVPMTIRYGTAIAAPDGPVGRGEIPVPASVTRLLKDQA
jgi:nitroimidazol reductase NimA-like FMN-containing flavoprotein (pyridoxamine 5'-phosphate oxidase superfamily)